MEYLLQRTSGLQTKESLEEKLLASRKSTHTTWQKLGKKRKCNIKKKVVCENIDDEAKEVATAEEGETKDMELLCYS